VTPGRARRRGDTLVVDDRAVVTVEVLLALLPVLLAFLGAVQLSFVAAARLVVAHSAIVAARSAAVVLDDDPRFYGGEPRGHVGGSRRSGSRGTPPSPSGTVTDPLALLGAEAEGEGRLAVIRRAAAAPLAALAPDPSEMVRWLGQEPPSVRSAIGAPGLGRIALGLGAWGDVALVVKVEAPPSEDTVVVRVGYLFHCGVPLAARFSCPRLGEILSRDDDVARAMAGSFAALRHTGLLAEGQRFRLIEARASYPRARALPGSPRT
jgi:hypothetical protein